MVICFTVWGQQVWSETPNFVFSPITSAREDRQRGGCGTHWDCRRAARGPPLCSEQGVTHFSPSTLFIPDRSGPGFPSPTQAGCWQHISLEPPRLWECVLDTPVKCVFESDAIFFPGQRVGHFTKLNTRRHDRGDVEEASLSAAFWLVLWTTASPLAVSATSPPPSLADYYTLLTPWSLSPTLLRDPGNFIWFSWPGTRHCWTTESLPLATNQILSFFNNSFFFISCSGKKSDV